MILTVPLENGNVMEMNWLQNLKYIKAETQNVELYVDFLAEHFRFTIYCCYLKKVFDSF